MTFENCQPKDSGSFEKSQPKPVRCGCGGEAVIHEQEYGEFDVYCPMCFITTDDYNTEAEAIEAWNRAMGAKDTFKYEIGRRSGKTLERAIDFLRRSGWLQEHDRIITESAESERWIPVTEALPDSNDDVLLQFRSNMAVGYYEDDGWSVATGEDLYSGIDESEDKPIAWMPLPEPWRGE